MNSASASRRFWVMAFLPHPCEHRAEGLGRAHGGLEGDPGLLVAKPAGGSDNRFMQKESQREGASCAALVPAPDPFLPGSMVVVTLSNPRDKFWGVLLALATQGLSISGIELASFEDSVAMVKTGESFSSAVVFFPMHRIERVELDLPDGNLPSLAQRFSAKTGLDPTVSMRSHPANGMDDHYAGALLSAVNPNKEPA